MAKRCTALHLIVEPPLEGSHHITFIQFQDKSPDEELLCDVCNKLMDYKGFTLSYFKNDKFGKNLDTDVMIFKPCGAEPILQLRKMMLALFRVNDRNKQYWNPHISYPRPGYKHIEFKVVGVQTNNGVHKWYFKE